MKTERKEGFTMSDSVECTVNSCVFNRSNHCGASSIKVEGSRLVGGSPDTCCGTYMLEGTPQASAWLAGPAEFKSGLTQLMDDESMKPEVYCEVNTCRYNGHGTCEAPRVEIIRQTRDGIFETMCRTFQE